MDDEREQNGWLGKTLRQSPAAAGDACIDAETLAAWVDGGLGASAAAAVELHASSCPRCIAVLAAMERSASAAAARHVWTRARLLRWLIPLTAAATAVAIWIAVPNRPVTTSIQELKSTTERADSAARPVVPVPVPVPVPEAAPVPGPPPERATAEPRTGNDSVEPGTRTRNPNPERGTRNVEPQAPADFRDELRREKAAPETFGAAAGSAAAPPAAAPAPRAGSPAPPSAAVRETAPMSTDTRAVETVSPRAERFAPRSALSTESISPANPMIHWRVTTPRRIERSTNGAQTWTRTAVPPGSLAGIRAVDANRAVVRTSDDREFYTVDAGRSWTRVQENSAAPF